jgi:prolyl-tRNA synthetase
MMRDGKALQMGTSHELGQNFARAFDMGFLDADGNRQLAWTTSWGTSTRMMGGLIMCHGDDAGLRVPPRLAATQVVVLVVRDDDEGSVGDAARGMVDELQASGVRARLDARVDTAFGRRATEWELKGVPVRVELGPRDLAEGTVVVARRDTSEKAPMSTGEAVAGMPALLERIQSGLLAEATDLRDRRTAEVATVPEALEAAETGFARIPWPALAGGGVAELEAHAVTVRCLQDADGEVPDREDLPGVTALVARAY